MCVCVYCFSHYCYIYISLSLLIYSIDLSRQCVRVYVCARVCACVYTCVYIYIYTLILHAYEYVYMRVNPFFLLLKLPQIEKNMIGVALPAFFGWAQLDS